MDEDDAALDEAIFENLEENDADEEVDDVDVWHGLIRAPIFDDGSQLEADFEGQLEDMIGVIIHEPKDDDMDIIIDHYHDGEEDKMDKDWKRIQDHEEGVDVEEEEEEELEVAEA